MFTRLLTDLNDIGLTDTEIALSVQTSQPTITRLRNGKVKEPMHGLGERIVDFHSRKLKEAACSRRLNIDPPRRLNFDPGPVAAF